ncbi:MAG: hypothetical protein ACF8LL_06100, partial [Phycisphaerales bacterium]
LPISTLVHPLALAAAMSTGKPVIAPESALAHDVAAAFEVEQSFVLNASSADMARGLLAACERGYSRVESVTDAQINESIERFARRVADARSVVAPGA